MEKEVWFTVEIDLGAAGGGTADVHSLREVARRTGRSYSAVKQARRDGRIPAAPRPVGARGAEAQAAYVQATPEQLEAWRVRTVTEVLPGYPDLPQDAGRWMSTNEIARRLGVTRDVVVGRIRRRDPRRVEWDVAGPWRPQIRYWLPDVM